MFGELDLLVEAWRKSLKVHKMTMKQLGKVSFTIAIYVIFWIWKKTLLAISIIFASNYSYLMWKTVIKNEHSQLYNFIFLTKSPALQSTFQINSYQELKI